MSAKELMHEKMSGADGFIAALDQSGGSTPKALRAYGIPDDAYTAGEESMYDMVHKMRTRIITAPAFKGDKVIGAILFENTMDREIEGKPTPTYLWEVKGVVPFLKCDKGLADLENGCQVMKPNPGLDDLMKRAAEKGIYGTKMRSFIKEPNEAGIKAVVDQQFEVAKQIIGHGLIPIIEPEVDIKSPEKVQCEEILKKLLMEGLDKLEDGQEVMLKLSLPSVDDFYKECVEHPKVVRVVALSGGYNREEANEVLSRQTGMIASFSRALSEGLSDTMSDEEFNSKIEEAIQSIYEASKACP